ncbi:MAG: hypothetical protein ACI8PZ_000541 [Myxococcota bacterium]|jgi:hypothetical protein
MTTSSEPAEPWAVHLLGGRVVPGGTALWQRAWRTASLQPGARTLQVGGASLSAGSHAPERIRLGAPLPNGPFRTVVTACAAGAYGRTALVQLGERVGPGGSLVLVELVASEAIPPPVHTLIAPWHPLSGPVEEVQRRLLDAGLRVSRCSDEGGALDDWLARLQRRVLIARLGGGIPGVPTADRVPLAEVKEALGLARAAVDAGQLQLVRLAASRGTPVPAQPTLDPSVLGCDPLTGCC